MLVHNLCQHLGAPAIHGELRVRDLSLGRIAFSPVSAREHTPLFDVIEWLRSTNPPLLEVAKRRILIIALACTVVVRILLPPSPYYIDSCNEISPLIETMCLPVFGGGGGFDGGICFDELHMSAGKAPDMSHLDAGVCPFMEREVERWRVSTGGGAEPRNENFGLPMPF